MWGRPDDARRHREETDMVKARLAKLEAVLSEIVELVDAPNDDSANEALIRVANIAEGALKL